MRLTSPPISQIIRGRKAIPIPGPSLKSDMPSVTLPDFSTKESGWRVAEEEIPLEPIFMDADRQKLELDITKEFEFADGEATQLIDEAG